MPTVVELITFVAYIAVLAFIFRSISYVFGQPQPESKKHLRGAYVYYSASSDMFPQHWYRPPINAVVEDLVPQEIERTWSILTHASEKYPEGFWFPANVIYILKSLTFYGTEYGGTYTAAGNTSLFITNNGYSEKFVERLFHAELSSVLYKLNPDYLDENAWRQQLPPDFTYTHSDEKDIALVQLAEPGERFEDELLELGFLSLYATTNLENDFNSVAKQLFVPDPKLWLLVEQYPRIHRKVRLTIKFYNAVHLSFSEEFFRAFEKQPELPLQS